MAVSLEEAIGAPAVDEEAPERRSASEASAVARELFGHAGGRDERPNIEISRFAEELPEQAVALVSGGPGEDGSELAHAHVLVPQKIGTPVLLGEVRRERSHLKKFSRMCPAPPR
jgi:hypothetical protein